MESVMPSEPTSNENNSIYPVIAGIAGGGTVLLIAILITCFCMKKRRDVQNDGRFN